LLFFIVLLLAFDTAKVFAENPVAVEGKAPDDKKLAASHGFWPLALEQLRPQNNARWQPGQAFPNWQQKGRQLLRQSYLWQQSLPDIKAKRLFSLDQGPYVRELWQLQLLTTEPQSVWLLKPKTVSVSKPAAAVLLLHDHGAEFRLGKEKWLKPLDADISHHQPGKADGHADSSDTNTERKVTQANTALARRWADQYFSGNFIADDLATSGFVVLAADTLGFGERGSVLDQAQQQAAGNQAMSTSIQYTEQQQLAANFLARGYSLAGFVALEDLQLAAFLASQPEVKQKHISALGFSMGAYRVWQLAALSPHISSGIGVGWFANIADLTAQGTNLSKGQSSFYLLHPGLFQQLDLADIAALAAPKPLLVLAGAEDPLMPQVSVQTAFAQLQLLYQQCQPEAQVTLQLFPEKGHFFDAQMQQVALAYLQQWANHGEPAACLE
jgi:dienelactone hydrolase